MAKNTSDVWAGPAEYVKEPYVGPYRGPHWHPSVKRLLNELHDLRESANSRANLITNQIYAHETDTERTLRQEKAAATRDAYDYAIMRLRDLNQEI